MSTSARTVGEEDEEGDAAARGRRRKRKLAVHPVLALLRCPDCGRRFAR
ncbi:hypothetical protein chiPu_0031140, partial [Chiloscyllium punctatum]|nr:hypothetical protein [Chiloscyllium punctatum]